MSSRRSGVVQAGTEEQNCHRIPQVRPGKDWCSPTTLPGEIPVLKDVSRQKKYSRLLMVTQIRIQAIGAGGSRGIRTGQTRGAGRDSPGRNSRNHHG